MSVSDPKTAKWLARELKALREYPAAQAGDTDDNRAWLAEFAAGKLHVGHATVALELLAQVRGAAGCVAVIDGDERGFADVDTACLYNAWVVRMLAAQYDRNPDPEKQGIVLMDQVARCWMHAEAIGAARLRDHVAAVIGRAVDGYAGVIGRDMNALCTLAACFATGRAAGELERGGWAAIGPYAAVVGGTFAAGDYDALATYHQKGVDGAGYPPFHPYPYRVAPFELLAIARRTGLAIEGRHALLSTPLARMRDAGEPAVPDELRGVIARAAGELGLAD